MPIQQLVPYAQIFSALSVLVAVAAIVYAWRLQYTIKAQDFWSTFLQKAMEYPVLAYPPGHESLFDYARQEVTVQRPNDITDDAYRQLKRAEFERYEWFLSYLLKTARQILDWFDDDYWKLTIERNLRYHAAYFSARKEQKRRDVKEGRLSERELKRDFIHCSGPKVERLIETVIKEFRDKQARVPPPKQEAA